MQTLIVATHNQHKVSEIETVLQAAGLPPLKLCSAAEAGCTEEPAETGLTFQENAEIKARYIKARCPEAWVLADDSGLCVNALQGRPGIYSARYAGDVPYPEKFRQLERELAASGSSDRQAAFVCVMVLISPAGQLFVSQGQVAGVIAPQAQGSNGFGYDPIFYLPQYNLTMAELDPAVKKRISHRAHALEGIISCLRDRL
ncbi:MAG: RdgB/HAM1 family non-canonical purine NTP pyrophosphatase [Oscillospiraceae bacterium]|nr:RdgB/HAM1 family non-canonical purine NTP pyrophosphatase [Oscillospiraceae bacterium]MDD4367455.1 RdgB/HAM1 family non-canonical purine NTP pyrophosphatase [Oscillospiraceae bacterium]